MHIYIHPNLLSTCIHTFAIYGDTSIIYVLLRRRCSMSCSLLWYVAVSRNHNLHIIDAVCCGMLQCVAVRCSALPCVAVRCSALQCVAVRCSALQCATVGCSMLQCVTVCHIMLQYVAVCCNVLQKCCSMSCSVCCSVNLCIMQEKAFHFSANSHIIAHRLQRIVIECESEKRVSVCCSVLQCVALRCVVVCCCGVLQ